MNEPKGWRWRVADPLASQAMGLRYEPGNWGDLLKAAWSLGVVDTIVGPHRNAQKLRILDPFCGRPEYPLTPATASRLARIDRLAVTNALDPWLTRGLVPSTGSFVMHLAVHRGLEVEWLGYDIEPAVRQSWTHVPHCQLLDLESGYDALTHRAAEKADWILLDPYDLFEQDARVWQRATILARDRFLLLYLYNKSSRGEGFFRRYQTLRSALRTSLHEDDNVAGVLGRVPSDALLPRAHHEVILLGPSDPVEGLRDSLVKLTLDLTFHIQGDHVVENPEV